MIKTIDVNTRITELADVTWNIIMIQTGITDKQRGKIVVNLVLTSDVIWIDKEIETQRIHTPNERNTTIRLPGFCNRNKRKDP
jgi:hypothetical protein